MLKKYGYIFIVLILFSACAKETLSPVDYVKWIENEENGLKVIVEQASYQFMVQYKPLAYVVAKDLKQTTLKQVELDAGKNNIIDLQYFTLRIQTLDGKSLLDKSKLITVDAYQKRLDYFAFKVQHDLKLVDGNDTLTCVLHHFEQNFGVAPYNDIVLAFELTEQEALARKSNTSYSFTDKTLLFFDQELGAEMVNITIDGDNINAIPQLKTIG